MKNHIQSCIRNFNSIKGFFLPRDEEDFVTVLTEEYSRKSGLAQRGNINVTNPYLLIATGIVRVGTATYTASP
jgi:hypothetical protein